MLFATATKHVSSGAHHGGLWKPWRWSMREPVIIASAADGMRWWPPGAIATTDAATFTTIAHVPRRASQGDCYRTRTGYAHGNSRNVRIRSYRPLNKPRTLCLSFHVACSPARDHPKELDSNGLRL